MMKSRLLGLDDCSVPYHIGWLADPIMITSVINVAAVPSAQAPLKVMKARIKGSWLQIVYCIAEITIMFWIRKDRHEQ